ncbi:prolyl oligopeptidase family serine peptidase [Streptomyces cyaneofuscatus]|uniref:prolyl oligopeptidase family serine peptidase n=1 Tax=Streptomyces cyaneofuscatus TaxID=66883 RepID=UPI0036967081
MTAEFRGERWHLAGSGEHEQDTFDGFAADGGDVLASGWSGPGRAAVVGTSDGGLLVGAALAQDPEKCVAVVCRAVSLDMVCEERSALGSSWGVRVGQRPPP